MAMTGYYTGIKSHPGQPDEATIKEIFRACL
jgi:hypothetical protein